MSTVAFAVHHRQDHHGVAEVVPVVDGIELTNLIHAFEKEAGFETREVSYGGLIPSYFRFGPMSRHFLALDGAFFDENRKVPLLGCKCGEWGCWPFLASITADADCVTWSAFVQPHRGDRDYKAFGPFEFERSQYDDALTELERALAEADGSA